MSRVATSLLFVYLSVPAILTAATTTPVTITKDPQAMAIAGNAMTAMGGASALLSYQDSQASGTLTLYATSPATTYPITLKCKGTQKTRVELQKANGINVRIVNQGQGVMERPDGTVMPLMMNNTLAERVSYIPLLSILGEYQSSNISVQYQGNEQVNGQSTSVIAVSYIPTTDASQAPLFASITRTLFYVDQTTGFIDKIQYTNYDEHNSNNTQNVEVILSNYQNVNGISVPFHQIMYTDRILYSDLVLSAVSFNVGLLDTDFTIPQ